MTKIAHNFNKYKYLIGSFIIIIIPIILLIIEYKKSDIYIYYDSNIFFCKNLNEYEKKAHLICYKNDQYSFEVKNKHNIKVIDNLKSIKITTIGDFFKNPRHNKRIFLVLKKDDKYEILPVKMYQNLSGHAYD